MIDYGWMVPIAKTWVHVFLLAGVVVTMYAVAVGVSRWYWSIVDRIEERKEIAMEREKIRCRVDQ